MEKGRRDVAIPAEGLVALRRALREEAGPLATIHTLHSAGYATGEALFPAVLSEITGGVRAAGGGELADGGEFSDGGELADGSELAERSGRSFWTGLSTFLSRSGWGSLDHRKAHAAVGVLSSPDWAEVGDAEESQPSCAFSTGMLAALLSRAADRPVAVVEVACRAVGDGSCRFAFGSEVAIHELYGRLLEDRDLESALASL